VTLRAAAAVAVVVAGFALAACGNGGQSLARQACTHVHASLVLFTRSLHETSTAQAKDQKMATAELQDALPLAAQANSADPQWNPLMTTLEESGTNEEANLVAALRAQCAVADSKSSSATAQPIPG
jgi:hypothetical protein